MRRVVTFAGLTLALCGFARRDGATPPVRQGGQFVERTDAGAPVRYTECPGGGRNVWDRVYASPDLYAWLFAQHR
jgi:hypothetical protein